MDGKVVEEKDIIKIIDDAVLTARLYGYGTSLTGEEIKNNDDLMDYLESRISREDYIKVEEMVSKIIDASETAGFRRGFHIAMRIMVNGLRVEVGT